MAETRTRSEDWNTVARLVSIVRVLVLTYRHEHFTCLTLFRRSIYPRRMEIASRSAGPIGREVARPLALESYDATS